MNCITGLSLRLIIYPSQYEDRSTQDNERCHSKFPLTSMKHQPNPAEVRGLSGMLLNEK
jgi:hypothetical protein